MYNLIVSSQPWGARSGRIVAERVFEYTSEPLVQRFKPAGVLAVDELRQHPTLLVEETWNRPRQPQVAQIVTLTRIVETGAFYNLEFAVDPDAPPISNADLKNLASELGINLAEFTRAHWAVKEADLFRTLLRHREANRPTPQVFTLPVDPVVSDLVGVMMPFSAEFRLVRAALGRAADRAGMCMARADDIWKNHTIIQDVVRLIATSRVVLCDLSGKNPNVLYEAGIAHMLGKDVILITQNMEDVPFDLRHHRVISYHDNGDGRRDLVKKVADRLETLVAES